MLIVQVFFQEFSKVMSHLNSMYLHIERGLPNLCKSIISVLRLDIEFLEISHCSECW